MNAIEIISPTDRYARCVATSKRVRWDIDKDVIRGRRFDAAHKFLPDGLSLVAAFTTLSADEKRFVSQIQGRTYANIFGLVERFINAKVLELSHDHWFGDQIALEVTEKYTPAIDRASIGMARNHCPRGRRRIIATATKPIPSVGEKYLSEKRPKHSVPTRLPPKSQE